MSLSTGNDAFELIGRRRFRLGVFEGTVFMVFCIDSRREKAKIYFALANSFGRIVDLGNVANTVFCCLQLFEEYRNF